jgi:hypothetical protein
MKNSDEKLKLAQSIKNRIASERDKYNNTMKDDEWMMVAALKIASDFEYRLLKK